MSEGTQYMYNQVISCVWYTMCVIYNMYIYVNCVLHMCHIHVLYSCACTACNLSITCTMVHIFNKQSATSQINVESYICIISTVFDSTEQSQTCMQCNMTFKLQYNCKSSDTRIRFSVHIHVSKVKVISSVYMYTILCSG